MLAQRRQIILWWRLGRARTPRTTEEDKEAQFIRAFSVSPLKIMKQLTMRGFKNSYRTSGR